MNDAFFSCLSFVVIGFEVLRHWLIFSHDSMFIWRVLFSTSNRCWSRMKQDTEESASIFKGPTKTTTSAFQTRAAKLPLLDITDVVNIRGLCCHDGDVVHRDRNSAQPGVEHGLAREKVEDAIHGERLQPASILDSSNPHCPMFSFDIKQLDVFSYRFNQHDQLDSSGCGCAARFSAFLANHSYYS